MAELSAEQITEIRDALDLPLEEGETWYVINARWLRNFKSFYGIGNAAAGSGGVQPGMIDNAGLAGQIEGTLSKALLLDEDYSVVHEKAWNLLAELFNADVAFPRKVILRGINPIVDLFPQPLQLAKVNDITGDTPQQADKVVLLARSTTGQELADEIQRELGIPESAHMRLWIKPNEGDELLQVDPAQSLDELAANDDVTVLFAEVQREDGTWPKASTTATASSVFPPPVKDLVAWRAAIKKGDYLDAQDNEMKWYDSRVEEVYPAFSQSASLPLTQRGTAEDKLRVHFMGWGSQFDLIFQRSSPRLQPLFTQRKNWRDFRVNDKIELKYNSRWYSVNVEEVDRTAHRIRVKPVDATHKAIIGEQWRDFWADDIADHKTHVKSYDYDYTSYNNYGGGGSYYSRGNTRGGSVPKGVCGLNNLGNTCFMASMLQCLSNTEPLTRYLLADTHLRELNKDNPLGCGGHLAEAYGQLIKDMWSGEFSVVSPTEFKLQIGKKAPQFQGYQQQDSQELMSFLMDGLNEDLNRVLKKPFVEAVESDGRPDEIVAALSWEGYKKRNDSVVVDNFAGLLRSHVKCNVCDRESTTFDPFMSLSVPIPTKDTKPFVFYVASLEGAPPMLCKAEVSVAACVGDVMKWYSNASGIPVSQLLVGQAYARSVHKFMSATDSLSDLYRNDQVYMFHVPEIEGATAAKEARKAKYQEDAKKSRSASGGYYASHHNYNVLPYIENEADVMPCTVGHTVLKKYAYSYTSTKMEESLGFPFAVPIRVLAGSYEAHVTARQIHEFVWKQCKRFLKEGHVEEFGVDTKLPYTLHIVKRGYSPGYSYAQTAALPVSDDPVDSNDRMVYVHFVEEFNPLLDVEASEAVVNHASLSKEAAKDEGLTLYKSFERFNDEEQLGEMDMWYCSKCKEHRRAYKRMGLWLLPEILIVHLKRFQYSQGVYFTHREKIEELVEFPIEGLDLSPYTLKPQDIPPIYDLYAVSNHSGGLGGGHYTAYARNFMNGRWYDFNDSSVTPLGDVRRVVSPQAYVLFYRRRKPGSDGVSTMPPADESHSEDARSDEPEAAAFSGVSAGAETKEDVSNPARTATALARRFRYEPPIGKPLGEPVVLMDAMSKYYTLDGGEKVWALKGIDLHPESEFYPIRAGEFVVIRGPSGGGKTSLLNVIGTIDNPSEGVVELFGRPVDFKAADAELARLRLEKIGFVFQTFNLLGTLSAFENVMLPMQILGRLTDKEMRTRAKMLLTLVGLQDRMSHLPSELSGGEQQRVTIARALCNDPPLLLLDEPTGDLDTRNTVDVMDLLLRINQERKMTCIMVTHNPDLECYADRVLYIEDGQFSRQAINTVQSTLDYESYLDYLNSADVTHLTMAGRRWVKAVCSVLFDTDKGQTIEECFPPDALSEDELQKVCNLALPESNTGALGDSIHTFRMRTDNLPLFAASSLHHQYLFGYCFFRQKRDATVHRGFVQRSLVIVTDLPFVGLFKRVLQVMGPIHFEAGSPVLEAAFLNMNAWPAPKPGTNLELPLLGSLLQFRVPWTGLQSFTPVLTSLGVRRPGLTPAADTPLRLPPSAEPSSNPTSPVIPRALVVSSAAPSLAAPSISPVLSNVSPPTEAGSLDTSSSDVEGSDTSDGDAVDVVVNDSALDAKLSGVNAISQTVSCPSSPLMSGSPKKSQQTQTTKTDIPVAVSFADFVAGNVATSAPSSPSRTPKPIHVAKESSVTLDEMLSEKQASELPGLYQELGLFTIFRGLCHSLWHVWELAITGQSIVVVGTHPELVGDTVLAIISLISPLVFGGDYRPYFSLYDPDFKEIARLHDTSKGIDLPCFVLGTTNPFFIKSLEHWPNAIWLTPSLGFTASSVTSKTVQHSESSPVAAGTPKAVAGTTASQADRIRPKVIPLTSSLCTVLPEPGQESTARICLVCRSEPLVPPDARILSQLLTVRAKDEQDCGLRLGSDEKSVTVGSVGGMVPAVMINNAVLRQHFRQLTLSFLKPFNRYFTVDSAKISEALLSEEVGLYDDLANIFLPKFTEEGFLARLKETGPPKLLGKAQYRKLYQKFIHSCHFWPWFKAKEEHALRKIYALVRTARLNARVSTILRECGDMPSMPAPMSSPSRPPQSSAPSHSASPDRTSSTQGPHTPTKQSSTGVISFLSRFTSMGSPSRSTTMTNGLPFAAASPEEKLIYFGELQLKIRAAFVREERLLAKDPPLLSAMEEHLEAVDAVLRKLSTL